MVGVDGSTGSQRALRWAVAHAERTKASVDVVRAWQVPSTCGLPAAPFALDVADLERSHRIELDAQVAACSAVELTEPIEGTLVRGSASSELMTLAEKADLLVVGSRGLGGVLGLLLGSVTHQLAGRTPCPLVVVGPDAVPPPSAGLAVVGVDGSPGSQAALRWAVHHAERSGGRVDAVLAWQQPTTSLYVLAPQEIEETLGEAARFDLDESVATVPPEQAHLVSGRMRSGMAVPVLLEAAEGADLLVVGSRGRGGLSGLVLGSVSERVAGRAPCPVVIVPSDGAEG